MAKVALVTGASRGIGRATAEAFARAGYQVAANYCRSKEQIEQFSAQMEREGCAVIPVQADVSDPEQVERMVQTVQRQFGHIDVLVCNAGIARQGLLTDFSPADWRQMMAVNLDGTFYCCRSVLPGMIRRQRRLHHHHLLDLGHHRRLLRGALFGGQGGDHRADQGAGQGGRPLRHPGQLHRPGSDRHRDERESNP